MRVEINGSQTMLSLSPTASFGPTQYRVGNFGKVLAIQASDLA